MRQSPDVLEGCIRNFEASGFLFPRTCARARGPPQRRPVMSAARSWDRIFKIGLVGDEGVGKTALMMAFAVRALPLGLCVRDALVLMVMAFARRRCC